jgi:hypothetical protein
MNFKTFNKNKFVANKTFFGSISTHCRMILKPFFGNIGFTEFTKLRFHITRNGMYIDLRYFEFIITELTRIFSRITHLHVAFDLCLIKIH